MKILMSENTQKGTFWPLFKGGEKRGIISLSSQSKMDLLSQMTPSLSPAVIQNKQG